MHLTSRKRHPILHRLFSTFRFFFHADYEPSRHNGTSESQFKKWMSFISAESWFHTLFMRFKKQAEISGGVSCGTQSTWQSVNCRACQKLSLKPHETILCCNSKCSHLYPQQSLLNTDQTSSQNDPVTAFTVRALKKVKILKEISLISQLFIDEIKWRANVSLICVLDISPKKKSQKSHKIVALDHL